MVSTTTTARRWVAVTLTALLLLAGAACSPDPDPEPSAPTTSVPAPTSIGTPAPGPSNTPTSTLPPPATTPVPQKSPGDLNSTVPTTPEKSRKPVDLDESSDAGGGVTARLGEIRSVTAKASGPGEVSGPGLAVTVRVSNGSKASVGLDQVVVTVTGADGSPGNAMSGKPAKPLSGQVAAGKSASGVYVFTLDQGQRDPITVNLTLGGGEVVLVFTGKAS
ncbi:MAG TPA: hypothetical protein VIT20_11925 [Propionibacteriaceae bacterium]